MDAAHRNLQPDAQEDTMPYRIRFAATIAACACWLAAPAGAFETYKVTGVAAGDALTLREEPFDGGKLSDWKELGSIPADATNVRGTGRARQVGTQRWLEVASGAARGWANARFLEAEDPGDAQQETFNCFGTEPFWGVTLGPATGEFSDPESKTALKTERVQPAMARPFPLLYRLADAGGRTYRATVSRQSWCSDGMSDYDHAFQVLLSNDDGFFEGCCVLAR